MTKFVETDWQSHWTELLMWSDGSPKEFKCRSSVALTSVFLHELHAQHGNVTSIQHSFFCAQHGKGAVDR